MNLRRGLSDWSRASLGRFDREADVQRDVGRGSRFGGVALTVGVALALVVQVAVVLLPASQAEATGPSGRGVLASGAQLSANQSITSPNGQFKLVMQGDGNLVEYDGSSAAWASNTSGSNYYALMQGDGNLVVYNAANDPEWASNTSGNSGAELTLNDQGVASVESETGAALWGGAGVLVPNNELTANQSISSPNGQFKLVMQGDGNLVEYDGSSAAWASNTSGSNYYALMQGDGNLVVYNAANDPEWASNTSGNSGAELTLNDQGVASVESETGAALWGGAGVLVPNNELTANQSISSPNGQFKLVMQGDGNLVEYDGSTAAWASNTSGSNYYALMQGDGNLVVYNAANDPEWASNTSGNSGAELTLNDQGVASVESETGAALWGGAGVLVPNTELTANQSISSPNGQFKLVMQGDGNLVEYDGSSAAWASNTSGSNYYALMQGDGNLVVYNAANDPEWASNTSGNSGAELTLNDQGVASVESETGAALWEPSPFVVSVGPNSGPMDGGTTVTITGTGLASASAVEFGSTAATIESDTLTSITAASPPGIGTEDVTVTTVGGTSPTSPSDLFNYTNAPVVSSLNPASSPIAGGETVTISGSGFLGATSVNFGGAPATSFEVGSDSELTAVAPAESAGTVDVTVTTSLGTSTTTSADQFTFSSFETFVPCIDPVSGSVELPASSYTINCDLDVPVGSTLNIDPNAILKFGSGSGITVDGTLNAQGTVDSPIIFTSSEDNSVGGVTGNGTPAPGDWEGITVDPTGSIDLSNAQVDYASVGVQTNYGGGPTIDVTDSVFDHFDLLALNVAVSGGPTPVIENNSAEFTGSNDGPQGYAYAVSAPNLDLETLTGNSTSTNDPGFYLGGTVSTSSTWESQSPTLILGNSLDVAEGVTMTIASGSVVKALADGGSGITVDGTLNAQGTVDSPIIFTSSEDNSVGGVTGNGTPAPGDWEGITVDPTGSIDLSNAQVDYASVGVQTNYGGGPTIDVTDSVFDHFDLLALNVAVSGGPTPVIENNSAEFTGSNDGPQGYAYAVSAPNLDLETLTGNSTSTNDPGFYLGGTVSTSSTWESQSPTLILGNSLDVAEGVTMTIASGSVVKALADGGSGITVDGTLNAQGTVDSPIIFTSSEDNSVGGVTGNGTPAPGDWEGITVDPTGSIDLSNAQVDYASVGVQTNYGGGPTIDVTDSVFDHFDLLALNVAVSGGPTPVIENNSAEFTGSNDGPQGYAYAVSAPNLDLETLTGNSTSTNDPGFYLGGTVSTSSTWESQSPTLILGNSLDVAEGVTMTIASGSVVKALADGGSGITVDGTLNAQGTVDSPIIFTSSEDNSVGGVTGNGTPAPGDWEGITVDPTGSIDLSNAQVDYASVGVQTNYGGGPTIDVTDSVFDHFDLLALNVAVSGGPTPVIENNSAEFTGSNDGPQGYAYAVSAPNLDLETLTGNSTSTNDPGFYLGGTVSTSSTWESQSPTLILGNSLDVAEGVTMTIASGSVVKALADGGSGITVDGTLNAQGTVDSPIIFTSSEDNSVGGVTGNGTPAPGDWEGITVDPTGSIDLSNAQVDYASVGVNASGGSDSLFQIDSNEFNKNGTAVSVSAAVTTNAQIEGNSFVENTIAIDASSNWSTLTADPVSCFYLPTMTATGNTFDGSSTPIVTDSDYSLIEGGGLASEFGVPSIEDYPDGWADNITQGSMDTISVSYEPCIDLLTPEDSYIAIAIPLDLGS